MQTANGPCRELKGLGAITGSGRLALWSTSRVRARGTGRPAAAGTAGRADAGARTLCLIKFIRGNKTVIPIARAAAGGESGPAGSCAASAAAQVIPHVLKVPTSVINAFTDGRKQSAA